MRDQFENSRYSAHTMSKQRSDGLSYVENREADTLLSLTIQEWCLPGTVIVSDGWVVYNNIQNRLSFLEHSCGDS